MTDQTQPPPGGPANLQKARLAQRFGALNPDALAKAEAALKGLSASFGQWLENEVTKLEAARAAIAARGMSSETADQLYIHAHDLKGLGTTYGFPLITRVAGSLCKLMCDREARPHIPVALLDAHLEAIRTIIRDDMRDPEHPAGVALAAGLELQVAAYAPTDARSSSTAP
jgi:chemotaxis protein histidine kinase CheA